MRYWIYALTILCGYGLISWRGINLLPTSRRELIPASVRNSPGGYRSYHGFSYGYHGGK
jgi:hypothetical protein